ncbi:atypical pikk pi3k protein kinase [Phaffia rhodozyma]|uniref:Phosphatidylinositol 3-kinase VPS34 n=1 Tax=Phaffia rhodozyma TaxID=264483 RepID=A0A0F7SRL6_PHARH|nr:atypical pikk pi3k protein kinase [Phaffia rhodozyma]
MSDANDSSANGHPERCRNCSNNPIEYQAPGCKHPSLCKSCAMKQATGGKCKMVNQLSSKVCDIHQPISLKIGYLEGQIPKRSFKQVLDNPELKFAGSQLDTLSDLYITAQLYSDDKPLSIIYRTKHKPFGKIYLWNEWVNLPNRLSSVPANAQLALTIWDIQGAGQAVPLGGTTIPLFGPPSEDEGRQRLLKRGEQKCYVHREVEADGMSDSKTPAEVEARNEKGRLEDLVAKYGMKDLPRPKISSVDHHNPPPIPPPPCPPSGVPPLGNYLDWITKKTFAEIERIHAAETSSSPYLFLYVELPKFESPVIFAEMETPSISALHDALSTLPLPPHPSGQALSQASTSQTHTQPVNSVLDDAQLWKVLDPDMVKENVFEAKHRRLVRSHRSGPLDRELKPNAKIRDELNSILNYPPTSLLLPEEKDLIWKYRFYLSRSKKALTKFLKSVTWTDPSEVKQAVETLLPLWTGIEMEDAIELLGPGFLDGRVRRYAVGELARAGDEELQLYLLQLVQALKFDSHTPSDSRSMRSFHSSHTASGAVSSPNGGTGTGGIGQGGILSTEDSGLADLLIERSVGNPVLGNSFHWYLMVECEDKGVVGRMYARISWRYMTELMKIPDGPKRRDVLRRQGELVATLSARAKELRASKDKREKKIERLRKYIDEPKNHLSTMAPLPLPINGRIIVNGISAEKAMIFKSNLLPLLLWFQCAPAVPSANASSPEDEPLEPAGAKPTPIPGSTDPTVPKAESREAFPSSHPAVDARTEYGLIFKNGDDLRQDQLVVQLFTLMDRLLRKENLDLRLTAYDVLATGTEEGMIQFIPSKTLAGIMSEYGSLLGYLRVNHPNERSIDTYGVDPKVLDTFVRSCAGYCVITYLLGVGDRHLDNLMLSPDGHFFHVDFGYILGRDPKPYPPPVKLSREMIEAMGGPTSPHYLRFKHLCHTAFSNLRKSANLILNLVALMVNSGVQDIKLEPDKAVAKIQENFMLHLSEEQAMEQFEGLLNQTSLLTAVFDVIHDWAQYWRS